MAKDKIQSIRDAEEMARRIIADAEAQKKAILEKAKSESISYRNELVGSASQAAKSALADVEGTRDRVLVQAEHKARARIDQCDKTAKSRFDEAVRLVISEIA